MNLLILHISSIEKQGRAYVFDVVFSLDHLVRRVRIRTMSDHLPESIARAEIQSLIHRAVVNNTARISHNPNQTGEQ